MNKPIKKVVKKTLFKASVPEKAKRPLNEQEGLYRLVVENLEDYAIFTTNKKSMVTSWNIDAEKLLGYKAEP